MMRDWAARPEEVAMAVCVCVCVGGGGRYTQEGVWVIGICYTHCKQQSMELSNNLTDGTLRSENLGDIID